jgi:uncharacterized membrane protein YhaH (DUF805 family)
MLYKYVRLFVACVVLLLFLGTSVMPAAAETADITVKVDGGLDGKVKRGKGFPASITLENKGEAFSGDLLIQFNPSYNTGGALSIHVDLPEGSSKTYQVSVPGLIEDSQSYYQNQPTIHLYKGDWKKGNEVSFKGENSLKPKYIDPNDQVVGVLSENYDRLKELRVLPNITMLPLTKELLPEQGMGLEMLDFLVIDEYAVSQLEENQQLAIQEWISYGGVLVAGAAPDASGSYGSLYPLLPMKLENEKTGTTDFLLTAKNTEITFKEIPIFTGSLEKGSEVLQTSSNQPATIKKLYGNGMILQTSFSLGDQPLSSWKGYSAWFDNLMKDAHQNSMISGRYGQDLYDQLYWEFAEQNEFFPASNYTLAELMAIMLIYLVIIVPVLYLVLKRMDKREHSWWVIPSLAIIMSAIVFGLGAKDRISEPQLNQMGIYMMKDGMLTGLQASTLLSNRSGEYKLAIPKEQYRAVQHANNSFSVDPTLGAVVEEKRKENEIIFNDVGYWSSKTIYGKAQKKADAGFTVDLALKNNQLTGTIQNGYPYDFKEVFVWSGNKKVKIGPAKAGETIQVNQKISQSFLSSPTLLNNSGMYPGSQTDLEKMKIERLQYATAIFLNGDYNNQPLIGGITKEAVVDVNIVGKDEKQNNLNLIVSPFAADSDFLGKFSLSTEMLNTRVNVISGVIHEKGLNGVPNEMIMEDGEYDYVLQLPEQIRGKNILFESVKLQMNGQYLQLSILNQKTGEYLPIKEDQRSLTLDSDDKVEQFFSNNGELFIKVHKNTNNGDPYVYLPQVTVKGEVTP